MSRRSSSTFASTFVSLAALLVLGGCGNPQVKGSPSDDRPPSATADGSLTVVGWSQRDQSPLGVQGAVKAEGDREVGLFDTRVDPGLGKTFEHLKAGRYRIEITHRFSADSSIAASVAEEVDLQPGERVRREVVIDDSELPLKEASH